MDVGKLAAMFLDAGPSEAVADPATLGDPKSWGEFGLCVKRLQAGDAPDDIWELLSTEQKQELRALDPTRDALPPLTTISAYTLLHTDWPEPTWVIPGMLPIGLTILAGKSKIGKSWLALQIAQAVATGGMALGERIEQGSVLYLALEDHSRGIADRMRLQLWPDETPGNADFMHWDTFRHELGSLATGAEKLAEQIKVQGCRYVVIDTLSKATAGDQNVAHEMVAALAPLQDVALRLDCSVVVVDHFKKSANNPGGPDPILDVAGSVQKGGVADCIWGLYREQGKAGAKLHITGRNVEDLELAVKFDMIACCWQNDGPARGKLTGAEQMIFDAMRGIGGACKLKEILEALGKDDKQKGNIHNRLQNMANKQCIVRVGEGRSVAYDIP